MASAEFRLRRPRLIWLEWAFVATIIGLLIYTYIFFLRYGYLPLPFFPDPNDVYADGYSTAWWTWNGRMYDEWQSVYPPFSFVLLKFISSKQCYAGSVMAARDCDWIFWSWMVVFYVLNGVLAYLAFRRIDRESAAPRALAFFLGLPTLYGIEHLNLLVIAWTGMILGFAPILRSARLRWLAIAVAINLKPYMLALLLAQLFRRRWRWVEGALIMTAGVYAISYVTVGGSPMEIWRNITVFSSDPERSSSFQFVVYATSYTSMIQFMHTLVLPMVTLVGSTLIEVSTAVFTAIIQIVEGLTIFTFLLIWFRPEAVPRYRVLSIALLLLLISMEPGGYTIAGIVFLVFLERFRGWRLGTAIICAYIQCLAADIYLFPIGARVVNGYLAGHDVLYEGWVTLGPFVRPGLLIVMQVMLVSETIIDVIRWQRRYAPMQGEGMIPAAASLKPSGDMAR
ncbi:MAG: glycosyltransferase family 87 protein [Sphingomicrobium sp.]|nr:DUF2029 domain-containing protein [Sphingomonadales bacterium]